MRSTARSLLLALLLTVAAFAARAAAAVELTVFGDSYSIPVHNGNRDWPTQLRDQGAVGTVHDFAKSGATAASIGTNTFARQIRRWTGAGRPLGATVVYLGYNDIGGNLAKARAGYQAGIDVLVKAGATSGGNRLILVLPHDVGSTPLHNKTMAEAARFRSATKQWDSFVRSVANKVHAAVADVFAKIDDVLAHPGKYGFTNVTTPDHARSDTTALYDDVFHCGEEGQAIIATTIRARLGGGALVANRAEGGGWLVAQH
jgi:phospholipase/lecithinase/hemolysin